MLLISSITARLSKARRTSVGAWTCLATCSMMFLAARYSMKDGTTFIANSATTMRMNRMAISPSRLIPLCSLRIYPPMPSVKRAEAPQLVQVEPDEERLADDVLVGHESPDAAVARVVPVVAHHEVVPRRNRARQAAHIVVAIAGLRK